MHARHCSPLTGRFLSTDKADNLSLQFGDEEDRRRFREFLAQPQSWNRYSYTRDNPLKYVDPDGETAELAVGSAFAFGGSGSASLGSLAAANPVGAVILVGGLGYGIGTAINQIPGVSEGIQAGFGAILDSIYLSQSTKDKLNVANGLLAAAVTELGKINAAGGPDKDPAGKHHKIEIKAILERAQRIAKRLPGKLKKQVLQRIQSIAEEAGVTLNG
jgi:RHS repeat-associated protein